jgi:hypothetical protein
MDNTVDKRVMLATVAVVLISLGLTFSLLDIGKATQYAGVGSFFVGLVTLAMSAILFVKAVRSTKDTVDQSRVGEPSGSTSRTHDIASTSTYTTNYVRDVDLMQTGPNAIGFVSKHVDASKRQDDR